MAVYLTSFYPLCSTKSGRIASEKYNLPPYIDGSCRREPDFENQFPCITGLCRPGFAQKLKKDDIVIYATNRKGIGSKNIISVLKVKEIFNSHEEAAKAYLKKRRKLPNDLMVDGTEPFPLEMTHKKTSWKGWPNAKDLKDWDKQYFKRSRESISNKVGSCVILYLELEDPITLTDIFWAKISSRKLCTQNPPILTNKEWLEIQKVINIQCPKKQQQTHPV